MPGIPSTIPLGSVVSCQEHAKRTDEFAFHNPKETQASFKRFQSFHQSPCQTNPTRCMPIEIMSATCIQTTQRHPTRFNTRTSQYAHQAYMRLPAVSCACKLHKVQTSILQKPARPQSSFPYTASVCLRELHRSRAYCVATCHARPTIRVTPWQV